MQGIASSRTNLNVSVYSQSGSSWLASLPLNSYSLTTVGRIVASTLVALSAMTMLTMVPFNAVVLCLACTCQPRHSFRVARSSCTM
jgi:hypothetical protein